MLQVQETHTIVAEELEDSSDWRFQCIISKFAVSCDLKTGNICGVHSVCSAGDRRSFAGETFASSYKPLKPLAYIPFSLSFILSDFVAPATACQTQFLLCNLYFDTNPSCASVPGYLSPHPTMTSVTKCYQLTASL